MTVEFTQTFTVTREPFDDADSVEQQRAWVEDWFWNYFTEMGWDVLDPSDNSNYEVLEIDAGTDQ